VPKLRVSQTEINFTDMSYGDSQTIILEFLNEGDGLLEFDIGKLSSESLIAGGKSSEFGSTCLTVEPLRGVIKAGEKVHVTIKM